MIKMKTKVDSSLDDLSDLVNEQRAKLGVLAQQMDALVAGHEIE
ncbi:MAG: hypothetical protein WCG04_03390 [Alphaproteobacteria bacterium]